MVQIRYGARDLTQVAPPRAVSEQWAATLVTFYETDPELIAAVLPKPLVPAERPLVRINLASVEMGPPIGTLGAGVFSVACRHGDIEGLYDLTMVMTSEAAVIGGREVFGEPKKLGDVRLTRAGDEIHGSMTRYGITYLEVSGRVVEHLDPIALSERVTFYPKFLLDPEGGAFDAPPSLVHCFRTEQQRLRDRVEGEVTLRESAADPVVDLPVRRIVSMTYSESNTTQRAKIMGHFETEDLMPFVHQRYDFPPEMQRLRPVAAANA